MILCLYCLLLSCDHDNSERELPKADTTEQLYGRTGDEASNRANPFDDAGKIHNEILYAYHHNGYFPAHISGISVTVDSVAQQHSAFYRLIGMDYQPADPHRVQYLLDNRSTCLSLVIAESGLSVYGKDHLEHFIVSLLELAGSTDDYETIYDEIVDFEAGTIADTTLTSADQEFILTVTSIARHSAKTAKKKPKQTSDPIWDQLIGNVYRAIDGADEGIASSVMMGLVCGIADQ